MSFEKIEREIEQLLSGEHLPVAGQLKVSESMRLMLDVITSEDCPNCPNQGWFAEWDGNEPVQVQCEFCYTHPKSRFQAKTALREHCDDGEAHDWDATPGRGA